MGRSLFTQDEAPLTGRYAKVVLERGIDDPDGLTYAIPVSMREVEVGQRVTAPLGRGNRPVPGYVVEIVTQPGLDPDRIKPLASRAGSSLPAPLVQLARWMARYYCCPIGMVLATMVPAAVKHRTGLVKRTLLQRVAGGVNPDELTPATRKAADALATIVPSDFPLAARDLAAKLGAKTVAVVNRLVKAGLLTPIETREVRVSRSSWAEVPLDHHSRPAPTAAQRKAIESIAGAAGRFAPFVLFGVTGSGKTEVYLGAIERVLARGEGAIVLVPEISLTPQTAGRFLARFGAESVAILHSGLTQSQRHDAWSRVARGEARIVVGARSAVFAPFETAKIKLGLIVVDEEHDHSYKQDQLPRYHARDVAIKRAQLEGCPVVLGSATPSLESWLNATGPGGGGAAESEHPAHRFTLLELPDRVGGGTLPRVDIVDIAEERRERPRSDRLQHSVGPKLELALERTLERGGQAILLLNRRGFSSYICCVDATCGWYMTCDHCDVTVVFHKKQSRFGGPVKREGFVRCHHCLAQQKLPELCPRCSKRINTFGFGTQRLEEELERKFPALRIGSTMLRLDSDSMNRAHDYFDSLERFRSGDARVIVGTQMVAKGLDFPGVELVGVINADTALALPDFRSTERTFQLVSQVAGRAGRAEASGRVARVIVQTFNPHEPAIRLAADHDYKAFAARELDLRAAAGLPPAWRMARIVCRDKNPGKAEQRAEDIARALHAVAGNDEGASSPSRPPSMRLRGPMPCPISRIAGYYRYAVEMLAPSAGPIQRALTKLRADGLVKSDAHTAVDVDPTALL